MITYIPNWHGIKIKTENCISVSGTKLEYFVRKQVHGCKRPSFTALHINCVQKSSIIDNIYTTQIIVYLARSLTT